MFSFAMGALSAGSLGIADFIASQSSERLGAARALGGMLLVSSIALTVVVIANEGFALHLQHESLIGNVLAAMHGSVMAIAPACSCACSPTTRMAHEEDLAPILFDEDDPDPPGISGSPVEHSKPSPSARSKAARKRAKDGTAVHSLSNSVRRSLGRRRDRNVHRRFRGMLVQPRHPRIRRHSIGLVRRKSSQRRQVGTANRFLTSQI